MFHAYLQARRVESEITQGKTADCTVTMKVDGYSFSDATASVEYASQSLWGRIDAFHAFCNAAKGRNWNDWEPLVHDTGIHAQGMSFANLSTTDGNLLKATWLLYLWTESAIINCKPSALDSLLFDEFILDYTGQLETQRHIYFLPQSLLRPENESIRKYLYDLSLLSRLKLTFDGKTIDTYFTPLVPPIRRLDPFDPEKREVGANIRFWVAVKAHMARKLRLYVEGQHDV